MTGYCAECGEWKRLTFGNEDRRFCTMRCAANMACSVGFPSESACCNGCGRVETNCNCGFDAEAVREEMRIEDKELKR